MRKILKGWRREVQLMIRTAISENRGLPVGYFVCNKCGGVFSDTTVKTVLLKGWHEHNLTFCRNCKPDYDFIVGARYFKNDHVEVFPHKESISPEVDLGRGLQNVAV
jgi:hypothetical protein